MESGNPTTTTPATIPVTIPATTPTTTNATRNTSTTKTIRLDASYAFSIGGILKLVQILVNIIGFILIQASGQDAQLPRAVFYCFVSGTGLCISCILLLLHFCHITEVANLIPWFKVEIVYCLLWILFDLVAGLLTIGLTNGYFNSAGYFAFAAMAAYALEAFYNICRITIRSV